MWRQVYRMSCALCFCLFAATAQSITPAAATLGPGATQRFAATCPTPGCSIHDWSIDSPASRWTCGADESNAGSIDQTGLYTAPATIATLQTVRLNVSLGDSFAGCAATITLKPSAITPPPPPPPPPPPTINAVPWFLGWPFLWTLNSNGLLELRADPTLIPGLVTTLPALGTACTGVQFADSGTELRVCIGHKWGRIPVVFQ